MPNEPWDSELGRTVQALRQEILNLGTGINARLDKLVSTEVYTLQSAYTDQRITALSQDLQQVRTERDKLEDDFDRYQLAERDRRERERQARLYQMVIPVLMGLITSVIAVWAVVK